MATLTRSRPVAITINALLKTDGSWDNACGSPPDGVKPDDLLNGLMSIALTAIRASDELLAQETTVSQPERIEGLIEGLRQHLAAGVVESNSQVRKIEA